MRRIGSAVVLFAVVASGAFAEGTKSEIARAQAQLTKQLNEEIARGVRTLEPAPPASIEDLPDEVPAPPGSRASS
jgi:hypothetical protein